MKKMTMMKFEKQRLNELRMKMKKEGISFCLIPSTDYHASEYIADYFKVTEFFSGCTSDNVTLVISENEALLWTDGRYFISAAKELEGTGIKLMKTGEPGVPCVKDYLKNHLKEGDVLGCDGRIIKALHANEFRMAAAEGGWKIRSDFDPAAEIWTGRPALPGNPVWVLGEDMAGESAESKLERIRKAMEERHAEIYIITALDEIMWTLNLRGRDIDYNPVALSFLVLYKNGGRVYLQKAAMPEKEYLSALGLTVCDYESFYEDLSGEIFTGEDFGDRTGVMFSHQDISDCILNAVLRKNFKPIPAASPVAMMKAVKNEIEMRNIRECYLRDSVALCRFLCRLQKRMEEYAEGGDGPDGKMTEISVAELLYSFRAEIPDFIGLSFETISAYADNGAIVHYAPSKEHDREIAPEGFLLIDSGGQYKSGTTDVTRTVVLGPVTEEMRRDFTLVAIANLRLLTAKFPEGCTGANLDMYVRAPLWEKGIDFKHGTGHGIGYVLNVHEGPHNISWNLRNKREYIPIKPGMIFSDEPGIYREGKYGIRTESIVECIPDECNEFGQFLRLRPLTYVPIDMRALNFSEMEEGDIKRLNAYHEEVYKKISPHLKDAEELAWLKEATKPVKLSKIPDDKNRRNADD